MHDTYYFSVSGIHSRDETSKASYNDVTQPKNTDGTSKN